MALRLIAGAGLWIAAALVVGGLLLSALFRDYVVRSFDAHLTVLLESLIAVTEIDEEGRLVLTRPIGEPRFDQVYSGWYWQISAGNEILLQSRSLWDQTLPRGLSPDGEFDGPVSRSDIRGPEGLSLRAVARTISLPGSADRFRYQVAADDREIGDEMRAFNEALTWSLSALGFGLLAAVFIQVRYGLRPLRRVGAGIAAIRSGQATRLEGSFPSEINPLSDEINVLLEHNAAVVERARAHVSNLAHALKTPLSILTNDADRATGPFADTVQRQVGVMRRQVDHYLARARTAATSELLGARTAVPPVVNDLCRTLGRMYPGRNIQVDLSERRALQFRGERQDLEEMLGNLLDNACKWAKSQVRLTVFLKSGYLVFKIEDDGPGLADDQRAAVFRRGKRLDETVPGNGLGLAIVREIAELYNGEVALERAPMGGLCALLVLPPAESAPAARA
ncbi:sensor histidine kinase [Rhodospirillaceae bacterium SYSU D60014]|uniref:ATP-binding protein n=1 Tax=Virgifigura deserti TaxID=2268457 RepID=UPI0013C470A1